MFLLFLFFPSIAPVLQKNEAPISFFINLQNLYSIAEYSITKYSIAKYSITKYSIADYSIAAYSIDGYFSTDFLSLTHKYSVLIFSIKIIPLMEIRLKTGKFRGSFRQFRGETESPAPCPRTLSLQSSHPHCALRLSTPPTAP